MKNWPERPLQASTLDPKQGAGADLLDAGELSRPRLMLDPLLEGVSDLLARIGDRVDGQARRRPGL